MARLDWRQAFPRTRPFVRHLRERWELSLRYGEGKPGMVIRMGNKIQDKIQDVFQVWEGNNEYIAGEAFEKGTMTKIATSNMLACDPLK